MKANNHDVSETRKKAEMVIARYIVTHNHCALYETTWCKPVHFRS